MLNPVGDYFQLALTAIMNILRSESTGNMHVTSRSPNTPPVDPLQFPEPAARPRRNAGGNAHHPMYHDGLSDAGHRHR
jgi:hypothetical protein